MKNRGLVAAVLMGSAGVLMMASNGGRGDMARMAAAAPLPAGDPLAVPAAPSAAPAEVIAPGMADLVPFELVGFRESIRRPFPRTEKIAGEEKKVGTSQGIADLILRLKGSHSTMPCHAVGGRVSLHVDNGAAKGKLYISLPSMGGNGGAPRMAVIKADDPRWNAILDGWKGEVVLPAFRIWARSNENVRKALGTPATEATARASGLYEVGDLD